ncbi:SseB family protein [Leifsonia sp. Root112D2]|uniref:SseB family protein n=1 Tax=Leifsonia sp. Root112D2 TaxID=1736426 RepID=UPI0006F1C707|nr:SseB family protein [Leifsonia sp. Root112D2]KQV05088.1 hypothetical protein ASC63_14905 [Leifsonia sp. Root112D2]
MSHADHPSIPGDSAGQPWAGRHFEQGASSDDDGSADAALMDALAAFHAGTDGPEAVVDAFRDARLLIPLVAHLGEAGVNEDGPLAGMAIDKKQELSIVTVSAPDGRNVLPVFSSVTSMQAWNPEARPVPADGVRVALAAASESTELVVLDATSPAEFIIRRPALWAMARSEQWRPAASDPAVVEAFRASISTELAVLDVQLADGDPDARLHGPEVLVRLELIQGLTETELDAVLARLAQRWAANDAIAAGVDSLGVQLLASAD